MREIHITPVLNGFIVKVGCQTVVFDNVADLLNELERYQKDPESVEKEYLEKAINKSNMTQDAPPPTRPLDLASTLSDIPGYAVGNTASELSMLTRNS